MFSEYIYAALATLLVVVDPVFTSAIFLGLTNQMTGRQKFEVALRAVTIGFCVLLASGVGGAKLLTLLGISLSAFRIAGGLLLLSSAAEMVFDRRGQQMQNDAEQAVSVDHIKNIAAFPIAIPLIAGPGSITAMILLAGRAGGRFEYLAALFGVTFVVLAMSFISFLLAGKIASAIGVTGRVVMTRLLGIILAALAVQFIVDGVMALR
jgi:multiple antibiotic resistance protein